MRSLLYALFLLAVLAGSIVLLRSIEPGPRPAEPAGGPVARSTPTRADSMRDVEIPGAGPAELVAMGDELLDMWHVREAADLYRRAVDADSAWAPAWVRLMECYSHPLLCREDDARAAYDHAARLMTAPEQAGLLEGMRALYVEQDFDDAVAKLEALEPGDPDVAFHLARALYRAGRLEEAERAIGELLAVDDTMGRVLELSVRYMVAAGEAERARAQARELARLYADEPFPYVLLAQVELRAGGEVAATEFCNNALVLDPRYIPAIITRSNIYAARSEFQAARVSFEKLLLFDEPILRSMGYEGVAFVDFMDGRFTEATDAMNEAIREAVLAGSVRRGVAYSAQLLAYLCELGRVDDAEAVLDQWIKGFGQVPENLGRLRVDVLRGNFQNARSTLVRIRAEKQWLVWARIMGVDPTEIEALLHIGISEFEAAVGILDANGSEGGVGAAPPARRAFFRGYAAFEAGDAEDADTSLQRARDAFFGVEYPFRGDPVLYVQSLFFLGEASLARGDADAARGFYARFLAYWGDAAWDLQAVTRAREKMDGLAPAE